MALIPEVKNLPKVDPEKVFLYGLMAIAMFIMVAKFNHVIEYCFVGLLVFWIGVKIRNRDFRFVRTPLDLPIFFFIVWILVTIPFAVDPSYSFAEWRKTLLQILMFYFVVNVVKKEKQVRQILLAFLLGVTLLSVVGIIDHFARGDSLFDKSSHADSLTSSGQWFSSYLVMGVPFVWLFFRESEGGQAKLFIGGLLVIIIASLFLTHTRGAWLALLAQLAVLWLIRVKNKWLKWSLPVFICGLILIGGQFFKEDQNSVIQDIPFSNLESMNIRFDTWKIAFEQIMEEPIIGYGYGNHTFQKINQEIVVGSSGQTSVGMHLHNVFVSIAYEVGLIGFALFALVFLFIMKTAFRGVHVLGGTFSRNLGLCILLLVVGVVTRNMFDNMFVGTLAYLFWLLTGVYFALFNKAQVCAKVT